MDSRYSRIAYVQADCHLSPTPQRERVTRKNKPDITYHTLGEEKAALLHLGSWLCNRQARSLWNMKSFRHTLLSVRLSYCSLVSGKVWNARQSVMHVSISILNILSYQRILISRKGSATKTKTGCVKSFDFFVWKWASESAECPTFLRLNRCVSVLWHTWLEIGHQAPKRSWSG